ncbi:MAG: AAA family ATPase [Actinomycetota bacterium]|nr:AAA family ATPase [Actinomycetota bacterium]
MQVCPNCGEENPDKFRLCGYCGTKLAATVLQEVRKTVTIVFSDLKGSTTLGETLDTETLREVLNTYFREMQAVLERHGGRVEKFIGDAIMAVFGLPRLHEDDALRAVRAAHEMQLRLRSLNDELDRRWGVRLENRTGVNTGEVVAGDVTTGQRLVTGDAVNTAARLEQAAPAMEILVGEPTYRLVRDAVQVEPVEPLDLKGKAEPVPAYRLIGVTGGEGFSRRLDAPMVGRRDEIALLTKTFERAIASRACQVVTILGQAGGGKSRLTQEFINRIAEDAEVLTGRCLPYGEGITFWPLSEVVRQAAGVSEDDPPRLAKEKLAGVLHGDGADVAERLAAMMGLSSTPFSIEETFWAARKFFEILSARRPLAVVFDDIHWAEPTLLDLVEHIADQAEGPLLLVCPARHELLENRAEWGEGTPNHSRISLVPLSPAESELIVQNLLGHAGLPGQVASKIVEAAEGNPLFVEQMLSMLIDEGVIRPEDGRWVLRDPVASFSVPPNISALLAARLDRLVAEERASLERGSVIGQVFYKGAVEELSPEELKDQVGANLASLTLKQLLRPDDPAFGDEEAFRFQHMLIRDVAYRGLLKRTRADLHAGFAVWLERVAAARVTEYEEMLGYHLERAYRYLSELGPGDDRTRDTGEAAARWLGSAGRRAFARGDMPAAANLLERATSVLPTEDSWRLDLLADLSEALVMVGELSRAEALLEEGIRVAERSADRRLQAALDLALLGVHLWSDPEGWSDKAVREAERMLAVFEEVGDQLGLANTWHLLGGVHGTACQYGRAEVATRNALKHAKLAGDRLREVRYLSHLAQAATFGPLPVADAISRCEEALAEAAGHRKQEAVVLGALSQLEAMCGNFDRARELYRSERATFEELGDKIDAASSSLDSAHVEMLADEYVAAERELRRDYERLTAIGEKYFLSTVTGLLAHALYLQGRYEESNEFSRQAEEASPEDDVESQAIWRRARAKVLARRDRFEEAESLAWEAHRLMSPTDAPIWKGNTLLDLAEVLEVAGKRHEAGPLIEEALRLYEEKGDLVSAARARKRRQELTTEPTQVRPVTG